MEIALSNDIKPQSLKIKNKDEIMSNLKNVMTKYERVLTKETLKEGMADRAELNKNRKELEDYRKNLKKEIMKPYQEFEDDYKEIIALIDDGIFNLDNQIKSFEEKDKQEKLEEIIKYFDEKNVDYKGLIDFDNIFQNEWLNKTYTLKKVQQDIDHIIARTNQDIEMFEETFKNEKDILIQAKQIYFENINEPTVATLTMQKINEIKEFNKKIADTEQNITKTEEKITDSVQNVANEEKVGRVFKVVCTYEKLKELNDFLVNQGGYETEVLERF